MFTDLISVTAGILLVLVLYLYSETPKGREVFGKVSRAAVLAVGGVIIVTLASLFSIAQFADNELFAYFYGATEREDAITSSAGSIFGSVFGGLLGYVVGARKVVIPWLQDRLLSILVVFLLFLMLCFGFAGYAKDGGDFAVFFGVDKKGALEFLSYGMGGVLTAIGLVALNRRATAQVESAKAQVQNNELIEKGHIEDRFKSATESLGHTAAGVRIAAFYQFYYLAKDNPNADFRKNIFEILCAHLRDTTRRESYRTGEGKNQPTEECQILLNILFKSEDKNVFAGFRANLRNSYLAGADLTHARMQGADFSWADLSRADFRGAKLGASRLCDVDNVENTIFVDAEIDRTNLLSRIPPHKGKSFNKWDD